MNSSKIADELKAKLLDPTGQFDAHLIQLLETKLNYLVNRLDNVDQDIFEHIQLYFKFRLELFRHQSALVYVKQFLESSRYNVKKVIVGRNVTSPIAVLCASILYTLYQDEDVWPVEFLELYLDDALGARQWIDANEKTKEFCKNILAWTHPFKIDGKNTKSLSKMEGPSVGKPIIRNRFISDQLDPVQLVSSVLTARCEAGEHPSSRPAMADTLHANHRLTKCNSQSSMWTLVATMESFCDLACVRQLSSGLIQRWLGNAALSDYVKALIKHIVDALEIDQSTGYFVDSDIVIVEQLVRVGLQAKSTQTDMFRSVIVSISSKTPEAAVIVMRCVIQEIINNPTLVDGYKYISSIATTWVKSDVLSKIIGGAIRQSCLNGSSKCSGKQTLDMIVRVMKCFQLSQLNMPIVVENCLASAREFSHLALPGLLDHVSMRIDVTIVFELLLGHELALLERTIKEKSNVASKSSLSQEPQRAGGRGFSRGGGSAGAGGGRGNSASLAAATMAVLMTKSSSSSRPTTARSVTGATPLAGPTTTMSGDNSQTALERTLQQCFDARNVVLEGVHSVQCVAVRWLTDLLPVLGELAGQARPARQQYGAVGLHIDNLLEFLTRPLCLSLPKIAVDVDKQAGYLLREQGIVSDDLISSLVGFISHCSLIASCAGGSTVCAGVTAGLSVVDSVVQRAIRTVMSPGQSHILISAIQVVKHGTVSQLFSLCLAVPSNQETINLQIPPIVDIPIELIANVDNSNSTTAEGAPLKVAGTHDNFVSSVTMSDWLDRKSQLIAQPTQESLGLTQRDRVASSIPPMVHKQLYWNIAMLVFAMGVARPDTIGRFAWYSIPNVQAFMLMAISKNYDCKASGSGLFTAVVANFSTYSESKKRNISEISAVNDSLVYCHRNGMEFVVNDANVQCKTNGKLSDVLVALCQLEQDCGQFLFGSPAAQQAQTRSYHTRAKSSQDRERAELEADALERQQRKAGEAAARAERAESRKLKNLSKGNSCTGQDDNDNDAEMNFANLDHDNVEDMLGDDTDDSPQLKQPRLSRLSRSRPAINVSISSEVVSENCKTFLPTCTEQHRRTPYYCSLGGPVAAPDLMFLSAATVVRQPPDVIVQLVKSLDLKYQFGAKLRASTEPDFIAHAVMGGSSGTGGLRVGRLLIENALSWLIPAISADLDTVLSRLPGEAACHLLMTTAQKVFGRFNKYNIWSPLTRQSLEKNHDNCEIASLNSCVMSHIDNEGQLFDILQDGDEHIVDMKLLLALLSKTQRILNIQDIGSDKLKESIVKVLLKDVFSTQSDRRSTARLVLGWLGVISATVCVEDDLAAVQSLLRQGPWMCDFFKFVSNLSEAAGSFGCFVGSSICECFKRSIALESNVGILHTVIVSLQEIQISRKLGYFAALDCFISVVSSNQYLCANLLDSFAVNELEDLLQPILSALEHGEPFGQVCCEIKTIADENCGAVVSIAQRMLELQWTAVRMVAYVFIRTSDRKRRSAVIHNLFNVVCQSFANALMYKKHIAAIVARFRDSVNEPVQVSACACLTTLGSIIHLLVAHEAFAVSFLSRVVARADEMCSESLLTAAGLRDIILEWSSLDADNTVSKILGMTAQLSRLEKSAFLDALQTLKCHNVVERIQFTYSKPNLLSHISSHQSSEMSSTPQHSRAPLPQWQVVFKELRNGNIFGAIRGGQKLIEAEIDKMAGAEIMELFLKSLATSTLSSTVLLDYFGILLQTSDIVNNYIMTSLLVTPCAVQGVHSCTLECHCPSLLWRVQLLNQCGDCSSNNSLPSKQAKASINLLQHCLDMYNDSGPRRLTYCSLMCAVQCICSASWALLSWYDNLANDDDNEIIRNEFVELSIQMLKLSFDILDTVDPCAFDRIVGSDFDYDQCCLHDDAKSESLNSKNLVNVSILWNRLSLQIEELIMTDTALKDVLLERYAQDAISMESGGPGVYISKLASKGKGASHISNSRNMNIWDKYSQLLAHIAFEIYLLDPAGIKSTLQSLFSNAVMTMPGSQKLKQARLIELDSQFHWTMLDNAMKEEQILHAIKTGERNIDSSNCHSYKSSPYVAQLLSNFQLVRHCQQTVFNEGTVAAARMFIEDAVKNHPAIFIGQSHMLLGYLNNTKSHSFTLGSSVVSLAGYWQLIPSDMQIALSALDDQSKWSESASIRAAVACLNCQSLS